MLAGRLVAVGAFGALEARRGVSWSRRPERSAARPAAGARSRPGSRGRCGARTRDRGPAARRTPSDAAAAPSRGRRRAPGPRCPLSPRRSAATAAPARRARTRAPRQCRRDSCAGPRGRAWLMPVSPQKKTAARAMWLGRRCGSPIRNANSGLHRSPAGKKARKRRIAVSDRNGSSSECLRQESPISAGLLTTVTPAAVSAAIFSAAVPARRR